MNRSDAHVEGLLTELGSAYYRTLRGEGTAADVRRAVDSVAAVDQGRTVAFPARAHPWRVRDVMTSNVVAVDNTASYKAVARLLSERNVNAVPVLDKEGHVLGMISEADLLRKQEKGFRRIGWGLPRRTRRERMQATARTAKQLMTSPAITIHPDARLGSAARLINGRHVRRLPVVDESGKLMGIVSRRDLLSAFLRPDEEIAAEIRGVMANILLDDSSQLSVTVRNGVVVLEGSLSQPDLAADAIRLAQDVDGVVDVTDRLGH